MKVLILGNARRPGVVDEVERRLPALRRKFDVLAVDLRQECDLSDYPNADIAFVFGGDGAILRAARQMGYHQIPVLGVNLGRLGFLADLNADDLDRCLDPLINREFRISRHLMYECTIQRPAGPKTYLGLNEVALHAMPPFHMLEIELEIDNIPVARFGSDGLIVSTPIGSTAHNLSAGGPILTQELAAFVITPICPHMLTYRPVVESADKEFRIRLFGRGESAMAIVDGQETIPVNQGDTIVIRQAPVQFQLVKTLGHGYFQTLREKLRWAAPPGYRGEEA